MKYCKKCTMPDTRPGITFDEEGVCSACRHFESRKNIDWDKRWKEFEALCDKYRGMNGPGGYDCAVAVSGGKDSHFQVHILKEVMHMNPILFSAEDNFPMTEAGKHNLKNISEEFGCTIITCKPNIRAQKKLMRAFFEKYGKPTWYVDRLIYTFPLHMALKFNTPFLCYGENVSFEYGGNADEETYSARGQIENGVAVGFPKEELLSYGVTENDLALTEAPTAEELARLDPFYLSYFLPWNSYKNYQFAKSRASTTSPTSGPHAPCGEFRPGGFPRVSCALVAEIPQIRPCHGHRLYRALYPLRHAEPRRGRAPCKRARRLSGPAMRARFLRVLRLYGGRVLAHHGRLLQP